MDTQSIASTDSSASPPALVINTERRGHQHTQSTSSLESINPVKRAPTPPPTPIEVVPSLHVKSIPGSPKREQIDYSSKPPRPSSSKDVLDVDELTAHLLDLRARHRPVSLGRLSISQSSPVSLSQSPVSVYTPLWSQSQAASSTVSTGTSTPDEAEVASLH
jgi:hypothetical protein